jgi:enterochelin esterase-like enzyme
MRPKAAASRTLAATALVSVGILWIGCGGGDDGPTEDPGAAFEGRAGLYTVSSFESGARGRVYFTAYLPPDWSRDGTETYPLIFFLHGQTGDEHRFPDNVPVAELNQWIRDGEVPPFVLVAPRGSDVIGTVQWYHQENVTLLTSEAHDELRAFAWMTFRAGGSPERISVHGHSRGASGAIYFTLNHWNRFASAVANAYVSDYTLDDYRAAAVRNRDAVVQSGIKLRMTIGTEDRYVLEEGRIGSPAIHEHLDTLGIPHEYEVFPGVTHGFSSLWHYQLPGGLQAGLYELQFHARAWEEGE